MTLFSYFYGGSTRGGAPQRGGRGAARVYSGPPPPRGPPRPNEDTLDDPQASRCLFLGNLQQVQSVLIISSILSLQDVTEKDIRRVFERYGGIGTLIVMRPNEATPYAFITYDVCRMQRR